MINRLTPADSPSLHSGYATRCAEQPAVRPQTLLHTGSRKPDVPASTMCRSYLQMRQ